MTIKVGVIGAGAIGRRRAAAIAASGRSELTMVADVDEGRAAELAEKNGCAYTTDWQQLIANDEIEAVAICTVNKALAPITIAALAGRKHVLCEKPLGRNLAEAAAMVEAARRHERILKVGFTLRFHPAVRGAHEACARGEIGPLYFLRAEYGHGGRPGYAQEWRGDPDLAGGGELLDQGVHLLDLARWFLGDTEEVVGLTARWFWEIAPLEDNAFVLLRTAAGQVASLHTSWTQWRNRFAFEVHGRDGYVRVDGLGGSYGPESLTVGRRHAQSGPPLEEVRVFSGDDHSLDDDWIDFLDAIEFGRRPAVAGEDGLEVMRLVRAIYDASSRGLRPVDPLGAIPRW